MANGIYKTEGIIVERADAGEADRILTVFTKDFGLLKLFARGSRRAQSKLNRFLNLFSYARFSFVSGRESWHLTDAEDFSHFGRIFADDKKLEIMGGIANFLTRFHKGEEKDEPMFQTILSALHFLDNNGEEHSEDFELVFKAKALLILGYIDAGAEDLNKFLTDTSFSDSFFPLDLAERKKLKEMTIKGMASSHL